ncbi:MAG: type I DNA topoisomerase [Candidatus Zixiibacteriota bacterium]|nr:MAG: type I DNA topoisomerase [candidate division Zixibacteria bacterium]
MAKNLLIVESPAKTKTLARFLGADFDIMATVGHIIDLPKSKIGVDPDNDFEIQYETIKGKEKVITALKKAAKKVETIYLAPDPDREGEAIAWHVEKTLKKNTKAKFVRVSFNEITKSAVLKAIESPTEININLVNAQQARRALDRIVGYKVSPFLWQTIARNLSAGRVQSVALRLVCEREEAIEKFNPEEYWQLFADLDAGKKQIVTAKLFKIDKKSVVNATEKGANKITISSEKEINSYIKEIEKADFIVSNIKNTTSTRRPNAPFITSTLQQESAKVFGMAPKRTMVLAQKLYEGIEFGKDGSVGLITYMRTDSTRISSEALKSARKHITEEYGKEYLPEKSNIYSKKKSSQDAHEAIRPTNMHYTPDRVKKNLSPQQHKLYTLIWNRFVASQMKPAVYDVETIDISADKYLFRVNARKIKFEGFLKVYNIAKEPDENGKSNGNGEISIDNLPPIKVGDKLKLDKLKPIQSFTKPPARFSEAMLIKQLEADGIGRPSTYATIVSTIKDRKYVELIERKLHPTELGKVVKKILVQSFPNLFNVEFTSNMERELDSIEIGEDSWVKIMKDFYQPFINTLDSLKSQVKKIKESMIEKTDIKCDKCGSQMVIKWGRNGRFLSCSDYPKCKNAKPLPGEEENNKTDKKCEKCGSPMIIKTGRFGRFMACSAYPECKNTQAITLDVKCPKEGCDGELVERKTKTGRLFYGCNKYPKCDYASWGMPVNKPCPSCKNPFMIAKTTKAKGDFLKCPVCKHEVLEEQSESKTTA